MDADGYLDRDIYHRLPIYLTYVLKAQIFLTFGEFLREWVLRLLSIVPIFGLKKADFGYNFKE